MNLLPGWFPAAAIASDEVPLTELTQVASNTSTSSTITGPAGIQAGDLIVIYDCATTVGGPASVVPSGFTSVFDTPGINERGIASFKIATGDEASAPITGMNGELNRKMLYVFRGNVPIKLATVGSVNSQTTSGNPTSQSVTASGQAVPLVVIGCYTSFGGTVSPRTFSPTKDGEINSTTAPVDAWLAYKIYNSSPANTSIDMDDEGSINMLGSFYILCS